MSARADTPIDSLAAVVRTHAARAPQGVALRFEGRQITWADLDARSSAVARGLRAAGVGRGDRVAHFDLNGPEYFEFLFGTAKIGAVAVDVNWRLAPVEVAAILRDAEAVALLVGAELQLQLQPFLADVEAIGLVVTVGAADASPFGGPRVGYEDWLAGHAGEDPGEVTTADDVVVQLYTSGTTGEPKGVMLTNRNLFSMFGEIVPTWGIDADSVLLVVMPLFHIAGSGWALAGLTLGASCVVLRVLDPVAIIDAIDRESVTHALFVPAVLGMLLAEPSVRTADLHSLEFIAYGASPITETVLAEALEVFDCRFAQLYGLTETTGAVIQLDPEDHDPVAKPELLRATGKPYPWVDLRIADPDTGQEVPEGAVGEVWLRSAQVMKGYWRRPEETAAAVDPEGWFRTGDAGFLRDGYLYLHDRVKDMIVSGGENVYPTEVENVLMQHPQVADVAVFGVPDARWGEAVKATVVRAPGPAVEAEELIAFARERLGRFKVPKSIDFAETLPRNASGKLLKKDLREPYWRGQGRRIG